MNTKIQPSFELVANKHNSRFYDGLSTADRKLAWKSYERWLENPSHAGTPPSRLFTLNIILSLLGLSYFCPLSDKDLVLKLMQPVERQPIDRCYGMVRLSQNERPLVWVIAFGGKRPGLSGPRMIRVRIGTPTASNPRYTVDLLLAHLHAHYATTRKLYAWTERYETAEVIVVDTPDNNN